MKNKVLLVILVMSLVSAWGSVGTAGQIGYNMRGAESGFAFKPNPNPPSSAAVAADAIIGRPLGLATTIAGTGVFRSPSPLASPLVPPGRRPGAWQAGPPAGPLFVPWDGANPSMKNRESFSLNRPRGAGRFEPWGIHTKLLSNE